MYRLLDWFIERVTAVFGFPDRPDWWCDVVIAFVERGQLREAQVRQHNAVLVQHWVDADTLHSEILSWFGHQIDVAPHRTYLEVLDERRVFLIDAPADEYQQSSSGMCRH